MYVTKTLGIFNLRVRMLECVMGQFSCVAYVTAVLAISFSSLSYGRSKASSKASSPHSAIQSFLFQMRVSSPFLKVIQQLPTSSSLSCYHFYPPLYLSFNNPFRRQFLRKMWPIQFAFRLRISCRIFLCSLTLSNTSSFLTWSVQLISFILLQHHISELSRCFWSTAWRSYIYIYVEHLHMFI